MNYTEINAAAYGYADRVNDTESVAMYDSFLSIVEGRVNRYLKTMDMSIRLSIPSVDDQLIYSLPTDFRGLRDIQVLGATPSGNDKSITAELKSPAMVSEYSNRTGEIYSDKIYYSIEEGKLRIEPQLTNRTIDLLYYQKVPALTSSNITNWLGDEYPDCYVFGILVEISAFAKDAEAGNVWDSRFQQALDQIKDNDKEERWGSGAPIQIRIV